MRDALHIVGLLLLFSFLGMQFPNDAMSCAVQNGADRPFASFVQLSPEAHAACLDAARTSWQVRSAARSRLAVGRLDSGIPLLDDSIAAPAFSLREDAPPPPTRLPPPDEGAFVLLPPTMGRSIPSLTTHALATDRPSDSGNAARHEAFSRDEMLSVEGMNSLKEIMK